ncbi:hypothetical protein Esti_002419 [Eimeria stiedai]
MQQRQRGEETPGSCSCTPEVPNSSSQKRRLALPCNLTLLLAVVGCACFCSWGVEGVERPLVWSGCRRPHPESPLLPFDSQLRRRNALELRQPEAEGPYPNPLSLKSFTLPRAACGPTASFELSLPAFVSPGARSGFVQQKKRRQISMQAAAAEARETSAHPHRPSGLVDQHAPEAGVLEETLLLQEGDTLPLRLSLRLQILQIHSPHPSDLLTAAATIGDRSHTSRPLASRLLPLLVVAERCDRNVP